MVLNYLKDTFSPERVWSSAANTGIHLDLDWSPNSPDHNVCDYGLFANIKSKLH